MRVDVLYDGLEYTIADADLDDLRRRIAGAVTSGEAWWLSVNRGGGSYRPVELLVAPGVPIALAPGSSADADVQP